MVVSLGGHRAYRVSYSHLYMAEVMGGVSGALACDRVYLMLVVFPVHSFVELRFLVFLVSFAASGKVCLSRALWLHCSVLL